MSGFKTRGELMINLANPKLKRARRGLGQGVTETRLLDDKDRKNTSPEPRTEPPFDLAPQDDELFHRYIRDSVKKLEEDLPSSTTKSKDAEDEFISVLAGASNTEIDSGFNKIEGISIPNDFVSTATDTEIDGAFIQTNGISIPAEIAVPNENEYHVLQNMDVVDIEDPNGLRQSVIYIEEMPDNIINYEQCISYNSDDVITTRSNPTDDISENVGENAANSSSSVRENIVSSTTHTTHEIQEAETVLVTSSKKRKREKGESGPNKKEVRRAKIVEKHPLITVNCKKTCTKDCRNKFPEEKRKEIHENFWKMNAEDQRMYIFNICSRVPVKTRKLCTTPESTQKSTYYSYNFKTETGEMYTVCKTFFLTTLGYHQKNDKVVFNVLNKSPVESMKPLPDNRGKHSNHTKIDRKFFIEHIESYHPTVSHYRREHAPRVRYLPSDVTITSMHANFVEKYPENKCSYELYRKILATENIHFTKLGHEECEFCTMYDVNHKEEHGGKLEEEISCDFCTEYKAHKRRATSARELYRVHADTQFENDTICVSTDMQKVIMLPRMEQFKTVIFTRRLTAFNQTFVPVGMKSQNPTFCAVWHVGISGRDKEDVISAYFQFFKEYRDAKNFIIWLDNCSAQNKNWAFFTFLLYVVNNKDLAVESITLCYFEPGHTFMSCDSFHHAIELSMKHMKNVFDFDDFKRAVQLASKRPVTVKEMSAEEIREFPDHSSYYQRKKQGKNDAGKTVLMKDITDIKATRGEISLQYKNDHNDPDWKELTFLKKTIKMDKLTEDPPLKKDKTGRVCVDMKEDIIKKLCPLMPVNRRTFWNELPVGP